MVISAVAGRILEPGMTAEEFLALLVREHRLDDVDNFQQVYAGGKGIFLVVSDEQQVVGTGALRPQAGQTAELKRMWLLEKYHGRKIGYQVAMRLFDFARQAGYRHVVLQADTRSQRAIAFYKRLGFEEIPSYIETHYDNRISMGMKLDA